jgi:alkanesulfonate monooxygenase SsuD/methylene tetrahydromethanopterin reductase-like flavin-dependent oxidoreductase (luciferase family)
LSNSEISPRPLGKLPIWLGVGGNPESALRAGDLGLPLILANITQPPAHFVGQIAAYRQRHAETGHDANALKVAIATHVHVAKDSQIALEEFYPHYSAYFREHAPRANLAGEIPRDVYEKRASPTGPIFVGSPQQIIDKLMYERELFGLDRFLGQVDIGGLPYAMVANSIELLATQVLPAIRRPASAGVNQAC